MAVDEYNHFVAIVAGDNPDEIMAEYNKKVEPYVIYKHKDAGLLKNLYIKFYNSTMENNSDLDENSFKDLVGVSRGEILDRISTLQAQTDEDFYEELTYDYDIDPKTLDALSTENPNGKWSSYNKGKLYSIPFITKDGRETFQARKGEVDWSLMHLHGQEIYEIAWDMVMGDKKPSNDYEQNVYDNMKNRTAYFSKFGNKENYVISSTAFWGYAFVDDKKWIELEGNMEQFGWVSNYYTHFIEPLSDDVLLTIFECRK